MSDCLILVDFQNDYFPGGNMELIQPEKAAANAQLLLKIFRKDGLPIVHIQHISTRPGATFLLPDTYGSEINEMVAPEQGETVIIKHFPNSFLETSLWAELTSKKVETLVISGAMSHMCIDSTTRAAFDLGFNCVVVEDACATRDLIFNGKKVQASDVHAAFMAALSGIFAKVVKTESLIAQGRA
jgi:nicotinamidase-related amidase